MGDKTVFWTKWRARFRLCRIVVLLFVLALVCALLWLDKIGLPDFVKRPLIGALRQHGIELQFVRLRLNFAHGLEADNVRIGGQSPDSPSLSFQEVQLQINYRALMHRKWQLDGVVLRQGKCVLPISATNGPARSLTFDHIQTELRFETNDVWALDNFQATFAGAKFLLSGRLTHAPEIADWQIFHHKKPVTPGAAQSQLKRIGTALSQIHFDRMSQLNLRVTGDARDINTFFVFLAASAPAVKTPWGSGSNLELVAHTSVPMPAAGAAPSAPIEIQWKAQVSRLKTQLAEAGQVSCAGSWRAPTEVKWEAQLRQLKSPRVNAGSITFSGVWQAPGGMEWQAQLARVESEKLSADFVSCGGSWHVPILEATNIYARLGGGQLQAAAWLNTRTREFSFTNSSSFDAQAIAALLTDKVRARVGQFLMPQPPELQAGGSMILPDLRNWTHWTAAVWRTQVRPTLRLNGRLALTNAAFNGLSFDKVHARFAYSNEVWIVTQATLMRPEGPLDIAGSENDANQYYQWQVHGVFSPGCIQPFLATSKARRGFKQYYNFPEPVHLDAEIHGRLYDYDSITAWGHAAVTNFSLRGVAVDNVETDFRYAHLVADFYHPHLQAGAQKMQADGIRLDWPGDRIYFTNGIGTADPQLVAKAIGPIPENDLKPYRFPAYPTARVNGYAPLRDGTNADLDFLVVGTAQLEVLDLQTPAISGEIHWLGPQLILTNLAASLYGGTGYGNINFDFRPRNGAYFSFVADVQNVDLHLLATDLDSPTNHTEGKLNSHFVVTSGDTRDWRTCNGYGNVHVRNGLLWDVPIFGIFSPILNAIAPGLGNSRATDATAQFFMTNGVISTDSLQVHTALMRMDLKGTMDLPGNVHGDVTAQLLRDFPGIGHVISVVAWPVDKAFEYKVRGTWKHPHITPVYIPRFLLYMMHPFHTLEDWFPGDNQFNPPKP